MQSKIDLHKTSPTSPNTFESLTTELRGVLSEVDSDTGATKGKRVADRLVAMALSDNLAAIKEVFDRIDGKSERGGANSDVTDSPESVRTLGEVIGLDDDEIVVEN